MEHRLAKLDYIEWSYDSTGGYEFYPPIEYPIVIEIPEGYWR